MREYLFCGKSLDNGEWVEGFYSPVKLPIFGDMGHFINEGGYRAIEIDPSTVGQFTGRFDKHGKQIFDGDILRCCLGDQIDTGVVQYDDRIAAYIVLFADGCLTFLDFFTAKVETWYEVIGNIHDNPELLKGGEDDG